MKLITKIFIIIINSTLTSLAMNYTTIIHNSTLTTNITTRPDQRRIKITPKINTQIITHCPPIEPVKPILIVRQATNEDLNEIYAICFNNYHNSGFKDALYAELSNYMTSITNHFMNEKTNNFAQHQKNVYQAHIEFSSKYPLMRSQNTYRLMVAIKKSNAMEKLVGYCYFAKINSEQISIGHIVVSKNEQKVGIGRHLIAQAFKEFPGVTSCSFLWLAKDVTMKKVFEKYCVKQETLYMDFFSDKMITVATKERLRFPEILPIEMTGFVFRFKDLNHGVQLPSK